MHDNESVSLGRARDRNLLGLLLLNVNRVVGFDMLARVCWGERPPRSARTQVRNSIARLRSVLGTLPDIDLFTVGAGYQVIANPLYIDLHRAIHLSRLARYEPSRTIAADLIGSAMSLWQRPVLADISNKRVRELVWDKTRQDLKDMLALHQEFKGVNVA
jgi:DNA-binding winged helix-turn-helix (wHTH) protein